MTKEKTFGGFSIEYAGETILLLHNNGNTAVTYDLQAYGVSALCDYIGMSDATWKALC